MTERKLYLDYSFAAGDRVVEMVPSPNQEDHYYARRRGIFIGNLQEYGHSSLIQIGNAEVEVTRRTLSYDAIQRLELLIVEVERRYKKDRSDLEARIRSILETRALSEST